MYRVRHVTASSILFLFSTTIALVSLIISCGGNDDSTSTITAACTIERGDDLSTDDVDVNCVEIVYPEDAGSAEIVSPVKPAPVPVDHLCLLAGSLCTIDGEEGKCTQELQCCTGCMQPNGLCAPFAVKTCGTKGNLCEPCADGVCSAEGHCQ